MPADRPMTCSIPLAAGLLVATTLMSACSEPAVKPKFQERSMSMTSEPITGSFAFGGNTVAYLKQGSGPAVIVVHGLGGHKEDFKAVMAGLAPGFTVYALDMVGFGGSSRTASKVDIGLQAEAVRALLADQGLAKAHLVGNSLGAWVAATFAATHPASVDKLVLVDAAGLKITLAGPPPVKFAPETVDEMHQLLITVLDSPFAQTPEFAAQALSDFKASGEAATLGKLFAGFGAPDNQDRVLDDLLPLIQAPTLVAWGANDRLFPAALADIVAGGVKGSRKVLIPGASHFPQIDNAPALNAELLAFLR
jgi:pimeloyl-ACP methyl ester carboxylesterase